MLNKIFQLRNSLTSHFVMELNTRIWEEGLRVLSLFGIKQGSILCLMLFLLFFNIWYDQSWIKSMTYTLKWALKFQIVPFSLLEEKNISALSYLVFFSFCCGLSANIFTSFLSSCNCAHSFKNRLVFAQALLIIFREVLTVI